jgi:tRNA(His) 5'-end guanylyltransferase
MTLGDRVKGYEAAAEQVLPARIPVLVRLDGNSFSRFTKAVGFRKPYDERFDAAMNAAAIAAADYAHAKLAYLQSDEITLLLVNDATHETQPFLGNRTQKLASILAGTASVAFDRALRDEGLETPAPAFDARVFVVPHADVNNVLLWRQQDAFRNCVSGVAYWGLREKYGRKTAQKMLHGRSSDEQQELIFQELGSNVNDLPVPWRRGRCVVRVTEERPIEEVVEADVLERLVANGQRAHGDKVLRSRWMVDRNIPRFNHDPSYVERFVYHEEEEAKDVA